MTTKNKYYCLFRYGRGRKRLEQWTYRKNDDENTPEYSTYLGRYCDRGSKAEMISNFTEAMYEFYEENPAGEIEYFSDRTIKSDILNSYRLYDKTDK